MRSQYKVSMVLEEPSGRCGFQVRDIEEMVALYSERDYFDLSVSGIVIEVPPKDRIARIVKALREGYNTEALANELADVSEEIFKEASS